MRRTILIVVTLLSSFMGFAESISTVSTTIYEHSIFIDTVSISVNSNDTLTNTIDRFVQMTEDVNYSPLNTE